MTQRERKMKTKGQAKRIVETDGTMPEMHILPDHFPRDAVNLCQGYEIVVTIQLTECGACGREMAKHPSGVCMDCFSANGVTA